MLVLSELYCRGTAKVKRYYTPRIKKLVQKLKELRETRTMLRNEFQGKLVRSISDLTAGEQWSDVLHFSTNASLSSIECIFWLSRVLQSLTASTPSRKPRPAWGSHRRGQRSSTLSRLLSILSSCDIHVC